MAVASQYSMTQTIPASANATRSSDQHSLNLNVVGKVDARKIMSMEHKALGYRPPPGSLASEAQAAAARHPDAQIGDVDATKLREAALTDAARIENERGRSEPSKTLVNGIDLDNIGVADARKLMSEEHKALGYRPPPGSLAADAQAAAAKRPHIKDQTVDPHTLTLAALKDAARIASERGAVGTSQSPPLATSVIGEPTANPLV